MSSCSSACTSAKPATERLRTHSAASLKRAKGGAGGNGTSGLPNALTVSWKSWKNSCLSFEHHRRDPRRDRAEVVAVRAGFGRPASQFVLLECLQDAPSQATAICSTVCTVRQLRAVASTPRSFSALLASLDLGNPSGVCR